MLHQNLTQLAFSHVINKLDEKFELPSLLEQNKVVWTKIMMDQKKT